ncbi:MAG TPA: DUF2169 domain-containing protein [Polyangiaceae bacterium]|nr:DUF2169 domain-containing protein [Polyangiaceae bacterium]
MRIKNTTPYAAGATVTSREPPAFEMVAIVRGIFHLVDGGPMTLARVPGPDPAGALTGDLFDGEDVDVAAPITYPSDFAEHKPRADVMLVGSAFSPGGAAVKEIGVRFAVGAWSKILRVVGPRAWSDGGKNAVLSAPRPFTGTKLDWRSAWGGPDDPANPAGCGRVGTEAAPSVEVSDQPIQGRAYAGPPGGFGPVSPHWQARRKKLGAAYGDAYRRERMPFYPTDFDWSYFNAAPPDQQIPYLRGDEEILAQNLHPSIPVFKSKLPGKRVRVFARGEGGAVREVEMHLDTLFVDMAAERAHLVWRGLLPVARRTLDDVPFLYVAVEDLADPPASREGYEAAPAKYAADPLEKDKYVPPGAEDLLGDPAAPPGPADPDADPVSAVLAQKLGSSLGHEQAQIKDFLRRAIRLVSPSADLGAKLADAIAAGGTPGARGALPSPAGGGLDPKSPPRVPLSGILRQLGEKVKEARAAVKNAGGDDAELARLEKLAEDPSLRKLDPALEKPARSRPAPGPGADFSELDLSGESFAGRDLSRADFSRAILHGASFEGAKLEGAVFADAVLFEASFTGADLRGAKLHGVNAASARFDRAILDEAVLDRSTFDKASFAGASLAGAKARMTTFAGASFERASAKKIELVECAIDEAALTDADFEGATLLKCMAANLRAARVNFHRARLSKTTFMSSSLEGARIDQAAADDAAFMGAELDGADFSYSSVARGYFMKAHATRAKFVGADLRRARFSDAKLAEADFSGANLFQADLTDASVARTSFEGASLYNARLFGAGGKGASFKGANLKRLLPEIP